VDREILRRFQAGDESALQAVYRRYGGAIHTVALAILRDPELAADATQVTFLKAWRAAATFDPDRDFAPWIYAIARRAAIDLLRKERPASELPETLAADPGAGIEETWEAFQVRLAVDALPAEEREVIRLSHFEGLTHQEIAGRLGVPVGTVKSRSHRAHRRLVELLDHMREGGTA
jgi:RNA polymerase sigma-70 factor (ECF subfamily)